jgi:hypothetical protein
VWRSLADLGAISAHKYELDPLAQSPFTPRKRHRHPLTVFAGLDPATPLNEARARLTSRGTAALGRTRT